MILIGQYDSPFVRRVGLALTLYGHAFEHRPWSSFGDVEKLIALNPLARVPTLVTDPGDVLTDSHVILAYLDGLAAPETVLMPADPDDRRRALRVIGLATGLGDVAVSLFYEMRLHVEASDLLVGRRRRQIAGGLAALEEVSATAPEAALFGGRLGHADIALAAALRFVREAHPGLFDAAAHPSLAARTARLEALPAFQTISQAFIPPN